VDEDVKPDAVSHIIRERKLKQVIVFSNTKIGASRLSRHLESEGVRALAIHGDKSQAERMAALDAFKRGEIEVLVATDVAARGLDIAELPCVINFDLPYNAEDYVHRIGRTGRAGASGDAISLCTDKDARLLQDIEKMIKHKFIPAQLIGFVPSSRKSAERTSGSGFASNRSASHGRNSYSSATRKEVVDPWFLKPYEPAVSTITTENHSGSVATSATSKPQKRAALLGGTHKS
jgi:superfamily II DNA/RNA helicase